MRGLFIFFLIVIFVQCTIETNIRDVNTVNKQLESTTNEEREDSISNKSIVKNELVDTNVLMENILIRLDTMFNVFPDWVRASHNFQELSMIEDCNFDDRMKPRILQLDLNGDGELDVVFPIKNTQNNKIGFAIIHKNLFEHFIIGAGTKIKNGLSDDLNYIDIWKINKKRNNEPGLGEQKPLMLKYNSIKIEKSDVGGGIVFWNGKEYEYFHQTC